MLYWVQQYAGYAGAMTTGRPRATSRDTIAEAACELFLEQGYASTTVADITRRAGVSRSSFFNYFASKGAILWAALDERIDALEQTLASGGAVRDAIIALGDRFAPDSLALALVHADAMGVADELSREAAWRSSRIAAAVAARVRADGVDALRAGVAGGAHGAAVLTAITEWTRLGAGRNALAAALRDAVDVAAPTLPAVDAAAPMLPAAAR